MTFVHMDSESIWSMRKKHNFSKADFFKEYIENFIFQLEIKKQLFLDFVNNTFNSELSLTKWGWDAGNFLALCSERNRKHIYQYI